MQINLGERIIKTLCNVGEALSHAVGNSPEDIKSRRDLGLLDPVAEEEASMGIEREKPAAPVQRRRPRFD